MHPQTNRVSRVWVHNVRLHFVKDTNRIIGATGPRMGHALHSTELHKAAVSARTVALAGGGGSGVANFGVALA